MKLITNRNHKFFFFTALFVVTMFFSAMSIQVFGAKPKYGTPTLSSPSQTSVSIDITLTAALTASNGAPFGAPAGFSLQWMTAADYALGPDGIGGTSDDNSWLSSEDVRLCKASFSGKAKGYFYNLGPGESVTVVVGDFLFDNPGASSSCVEPLLCDTDYVFRSFAHGDNRDNRSDFSANVFASTLECDGDIGGCTYTQGYWKNHCAILDEEGNVDSRCHQVIPWTPGGDLFNLGTAGYPYTDLDWLDIFHTPGAGNGLITLSHQLMAAKLNRANGADISAVSGDMAAADALIGSLVVPPVGGGFLSPGSTSALNDSLTDFNEGVTGPGHCDDDPPQQ
jgi:hypothetical protein